ncbi:MAG: hypothetical protein RLZZ283_36 [Candidatus Parcubacteria bacterium]|jgi:hypothetical protein
MSMYNPATNTARNNVYNNAHHGTGAKQGVMNTVARAHPGLFPAAISFPFIRYAVKFIFHSIHRA